MKASALSVQHLSKSRAKVHTDVIDIAHDGKQVILTFPSEQAALNHIKTCSFRVKLLPEEEDIGCGDCNTCLTPIC
jgi:hypothetical protein